MRARSLLRDDLERAGVTIHEHAGVARFVDPHVIESESAPRLRSKTVIICTGGVARRLSVPGSELAGTHSDAWRLTSAPESMLVIGAGATGVQVASIFGAFGSQVTLFQASARILTSEDGDVAAAMSRALEASGLRVLEDAGTIDRFEKCPAGVRLIYSKGGARKQLDSTMVVAAIGWVANTDGLDLDAAGVQSDSRGFIQVDSRLRTSTPNIFAAGDVTGHVMVVHHAVREAYVAATNAALGRSTTLPAEVSPLGSFTDPEYASVGLTEAAARDAHDVVVATERFDSLPRPIIDGRPTGFCKVIVGPHVAHNPRLPHRRRARGRASSAGGGCDGGPDEGRATRTGSVHLPHVRQRPRARGTQSRPPTRRSRQLAGRRVRRGGRPRCDRRVSRTERTLGRLASLRAMTVLPGSSPKGDGG